jgi:hypothetical protein
MWNAKVRLAREPGVAIDGRLAQLLDKPVRNGVVSDVRVFADRKRGRFYFLEK